MALSKRIGSKFIYWSIYWSRCVGKFSRRLRDATGTFFKRLWRGDEVEEKKVVLKKGLKRAVLRCLIHLSAVSATTTIAYFNLAGYFIGSQFQALTGGVYQALDTLCLQVTAKLLVNVFAFSISYYEVRKIERAAGSFCAHNEGHKEESSQLRIA